MLLTALAAGQVTWSGGVKVAGNVGGNNMLGPPFYRGSTTSTADPNYGVGGQLTPIFTSTEYVGTVNTSGTAVSWVSGDQFPLSCPNTQILINNLPFTIASCNSATSITLTGSAGTLTSKVYGLCQGNCQNSVAYDTTINPSGINAITRITDMSTMANGNSIGNFTCSAGANNANISSLGNYFGPVMQGGQFRIYHIGIVNNQVQVLNPGIPPLAVPCSASMGMAPADDRAAFYRTGSEIHKTTWDANATTFLTDTVMVDLANCPGSSAFTIAGSSEMQMDTADDVFAQATGPIGNQGYATVMVFYKASTNQCRAVNLQTGAMYDWCTPGAGCAAEAPNNTLANGGNTCWGIPRWTGTASVAANGQTVTWVSGQKFTFDAAKNLSLHQGTSCLAAGGLRCDYPYSIVSDTQLTLGITATFTQLGCGSLPCTVTFDVINGIHAIQESTGGQYAWASFGENGGWAITGVDNPSAAASLTTFCAGNTRGSQLAIVPVDSANNVTIYANNDPNNTQGISGFRSAGQHPSFGMSHILNAYPDGPNLRSVTDVSHWTVFAPAETTFADTHGTWPHFCTNKTVGDDSCPGLQLSDLPNTTIGVGACGNPVYCPSYLNMAIFAYQPNATSPQNPWVFFHSFACGAAVGARCTNGFISTAAATINYTDPQGRFICWRSDMLGALGHDGDGNPEVAAFCGMLQ